VAAPSCVREHTVERPRHPAEIERLDERRREADLPVRQEAAQLVLDRPVPVRGLLLVGAKRSKLAVSGEDLLHGRSAKAPDQLVLQIPVAHVEAEAFHLRSAELDTEPRALQSTPEPVLLTGVEEAGQRDVGATRPVAAQEPSDRLRAPDR
jgi:hypothetical protein